MATWEEASRCYKCQEPGLEVADKPAAERHQGRVKILECQNERCKNFGVDGRWIIQVRPDGTIPDARKPGIVGAGAFPPMSTGMQQMAQSQLDALKREEDQQH
jgi:hypothetical protein